MKKSVGVGLALLLLFLTWRADGTSHGPPGKPALTRCRSPEKETFTCWWEPGPDGGLPTTYALYYRKESSEKVYECPDYRTAGENSCFFNKNNTSIWVNYNITVKASNAAGSTFSDPVDIDVVYIVKPNAPEQVSVSVLEDGGWPFLRVSWEPPHKADTRSGWITLIYELRVRLEGQDDWEMHVAGQQKTFNIFSLRSGGQYLVQVRCKPDHGFWSEWSSTSNIKVPDYFHREKSVWILMVAFSALIFLILTWLLHINSHSLKHCLLPPVPGPKIKGFDKQLLKNGKCDEIFSALVVSDFPPTASCYYDDLLVEYLEVCVPEERELMLEESKELHDGSLKSSKGSACDSDSGRGSCDSHTLLMDKCAEAKSDSQRPKDPDDGPAASSERRQKHWEEQASTHTSDYTGSPDMSAGRAKTWPSVYSPLPQYSSSAPGQRQSSLEASKQRRLSKSSYLSQPGHAATYWDSCLSDKQPRMLHAQAPGHQQLQSLSDINVSRLGLKHDPTGPRQSTEYVEVQRVNEEDMVLLQPVAVPCPTPLTLDGVDYSKVKGVDGDNVPLLQRQAEEDGEMNGVTENRYTSSTVATQQKPSMACIIPTHTQEKVVPVGSGYVDPTTTY